MYLKHIIPQVPSSNQFRSVAVQRHHIHNHHSGLPSAVVLLWYIGSFIVFMYIYIQRALIVIPVSSVKEKTRGEYAYAIAIAMMRTCSHTGVTQHTEAGSGTRRMKWWAMCHLLIWLLEPSRISYSALTTDIQQHPDIQQQPSITAYFRLFRFLPVLT